MDETDRKQDRSVRHRAQQAQARIGSAVLVAITLLCAAACTKAHSSAPPSSPAGSIVSSAAASSPASVASSAAASASGSAVSGVDPLTGLPPSTAAALTRPALGVKIDNVAGAFPQAGVNQADIVFEIPVEGGLTRLLAVFHSQNVPLLGPVRSARPVDATLMQLFGKSYFAFSGGSKSDLAPITSDANLTPMWWDVTPSLFVTRTDHAVPHQVFANTATLYAGGEARKPSKTPPSAVFTYSTTAPTAATKATSITAQYDAATALWTWDGTKYLRTQNGNPDKLMDGGQISSTNVVVMSVSLQATAARDSHGSVVPLPVVTGSGSVWVFRNGVMEKGIWSRPKTTSPMKLLTSSGQIIALAPGRTWVEVLPNSRQPQVH
jgi:Protein of unknown function (DUF3048) N-terminal domain/Protein of unknown function (DUF3048) C-terminal domain